MPACRVGHPVGSVSQRQLTAVGRAPVCWKIVNKQSSSVQHTRHNAPGTLESAAAAVAVVRGLCGVSAKQHTHTSEISRAFCNCKCVYIDCRYTMMLEQHQGKVMRHSHRFASERGGHWQVHRADLVEQINPSALVYKTYPLQSDNDNDMEYSLDRHSTHLCLTMCLCFSLCFFFIVLGGAERFKQTPNIGHPIEMKWNVFFCLWLVTNKENNKKKLGTDSVERKSSRTRYT